MERKDDYHLVFCTLKTVEDDLGFPCACMKQIQHFLQCCRGPSRGPLAALTAGPGWHPSSGIKRPGLGKMR